MDERSLQPPRHVFQQACSLRESLSGPSLAIWFASCPKVVAICAPTGHGHHSNLPVPFTRFILAPTDDRSLPGGLRFTRNKQNRSANCERRAPTITATWSGTHSRMRQFRDLVNEDCPNNDNDATLTGEEAPPKGTGEERLPPPPGL